MPEDKIDWQMLVNAESETGMFDFIHHSTSSTIQLIKFGEDGKKETEFWMDYYEWKDLCDLIKRIS